MRRGVQPGAIACDTENAFQHRAGRTLAVGSAYGDDGERRMEIKARLNFADALKTQCDRFGMEAFEMKQPIG